MNIKAICLGAALALSSGAAFADHDAPNYLQSLYADSSMTTLKPMPEFKAAFMALSEEQRKMTMNKCQDAPQTKPYADICANLNKMRGM